MRSFDARLEGISLSANHQPLARLSCKPADIPSPGQAIMACKSGSCEPLRKLLFPTHLLPDGFVADSPPEAHWRIGDPLNLWGPIGHGFTPASNADKWLLASFDNPPARLWPLIQTGLERGVAISLCTEVLPAKLPPQVEWIPEIIEALIWADYLALDLPSERITSIRSRLGLSSQERLPIPAQVLVTQPMPCGLGVCYACALKGYQNQLLSCKDGPVFDLDQLEF